MAFASSVLELQHCNTLQKGVGVLGAEMLGRNARGQKFERKKEKIGQLFVDRNLNVVSLQRHDKGGRAGGGAQRCTRCPTRAQVSADSPAERV